MKVTAQKLCLVLNLAAAIAAVSAFLMAHGGWRGDVDPYFEQIAVPELKNPHADGVLFNRWQISYDDEPLPFRLFVYVNSPAMLLALLLNKGLFLFPPFAHEGFPLGLSYPSYLFVLFLTCSFVQWLLIGMLIDRWRTRSSQSRADASGLQLRPRLRRK